MARFGLTEHDIYQGANKTVLGYFFDQYVRACGFTPTSSWVFIVRPSGECEFTPLQPGEPYWCCENEERIGEEVGLPTTGSPPWEIERTWRCPLAPETKSSNASTQGDSDDKRYEHYDGPSDIGAERADIGAERAPSVAR
jgi:hypothetical protein